MLKAYTQSQHESCSSASQPQTRQCSVLESRYQPGSAEHTYNSALSRLRQEGNKSGATLATQKVSSQREGGKEGGGRDNRNKRQMAFKGQSQGLQLLSLPSVTSSAGLRAEV